MGVWKKILLLYTGGCAYMGVELAWRGWSHSSMFLAGGTCFLLLGQLQKVQPRLHWLPRAMVGAGIITGVELLAGLLVNRDYGVWDYRHVPGNFHGQVCLPFSLLWIPLSLGAMGLYSLLERHLPE